MSRGLESFAFKINRDTNPLLNRDPFACKTDECYRETCRRTLCPKVMPRPLLCPRSEQELLPLGERPCCGNRKRCVSPKALHKRDETSGNRDATDLYASCGILPILPSGMGGPRRATVDEVLEVAQRHASW